MKKIYLAGPDVFFSYAIEHGKKLISKCAEYGFQGLFPLDNEVDESSIVLMREDIKSGNIEMIKECDIILANIDPFRGPGADNGTTYEIGYAEALGKQVVLYVNDEKHLDDYKQKVIISENLTPGSTTDKKNMTIEDFGLPDNLMFAGHTTCSSFENALKYLAQLT